MTLNKQKLNDYFGKNAKIRVDSYWREDDGWINIPMEAVYINNSTGENYFTAFLELIKYNQGTKVAIKIPGIHNFTADFSIYELLV